MNDGQYKKFVTLQHKFLKMGWEMRRDFEKSIPLLLFVNDTKKCCVGINEYNGYIRFRPYDDDNANNANISLLETQIIYKLAALFRASLEEKIGKRL